MQLLFNDHDKNLLLSNLFFSIPIKMFFFNWVNKRYLSLQVEVVYK